MDFLKTLLAYAALLSTLAVQEGPQPQTVPTPTMLPPSVTATLVPHQTEAPTATPSPTPPPVPTITPNLNYETLEFNMRGNDVRKLQKKLIELGYMPEGSADGAYGYQTYNAVRDFQSANGLSADGVAGPATLTNLYQNKNVRPKMTATVAPTATPTPTLPPLPTPDAWVATPVPVTPVPETPVPETPVPETPVPEAGMQELPMPEETAALPEFPDTLSQPAMLGLAEVPDALIISGNTGKALAMAQTVDGVVVPLKPQLWQNAAGNAVMLLRDLADCYEGWSFTGSAADGLYTLEAAGYAVTIQFAGNGVLVTVDGEVTTLTTADVQLQGGALYVTDEFLRATLKAQTIFDEEERSLVLFITEKSFAQATD